MFILVQVPFRRPTTIGIIGVIGTVPVSLCRLCPLCPMALQRRLVGPAEVTVCQETSDADWPCDADCPNAGAGRHSMRGLGVETTDHDKRGTPDRRQSNPCEAGNPIVWPSMEQLTLIVAGLTLNFKKNLSLSP
jgi:hypothetical protein